MIDLLINIIVWFVGVIMGGWLMIKDKNYVGSGSWVKVSEVNELYNKIDKMENCHNCFYAKFQTPSCNDCDLFSECKHGRYKGKKQYYKNHWSLK